MIGRLLDQRYQVVELLGKGGFGHTYIAQDTRRPGNPACVVKHLKPITSDPEFLPLARRLFNREAETLENLGHNDQIPRLLAYFEENEEFYLVQELVEGHPLSWEMAPGTRWSEEQVIQLLQEVLPILEFIHSHGVIHRDLKPDNLIRRASDNKIVLVDFGAVKQIKSYSLMTTEQLKNDTLAVGTPGYMPSEQGQGRPRPCSDIYALGITCIQAITGLNPKQLGEDAGTGEILWQHHAQVSNQLAAILNKMIRHYFKYRYQTATEVLQSLTSITNASTPGVVASVMTQMVGHYLKDGYVTATKVMQYLQELAKPCYVPPENGTNSDPTLPPLTAASTLRASEVKSSISNTTTTNPIPTRSPSKIQVYIRSIPQSKRKSRLFIGGGAAIAIAALGIMSANNSQKLASSSSTPQKEVKPVATTPSQPEQKTGCLTVISSSNLRAGSGQRRTGKVIKAGTQVTTTGRLDGGWVEISAPEVGWIWKSRTRNSCAK
ncbi:serine/threonine protein kinase [Calothrix sp. FACHB-1219]|uniref:serine/threonine protein kinase n=1 Tax=unclassified Calothrix TaxID=2619626 RepID=UPI00168559FE|nr:MULTISPECIES: serine/threonine protein kinase [unclassified Calothrix]MBD2201364.1 serine/threonine protein kinase [Calothrix sp. FACHB-168]MBD2215798.1 serine/threonine protein kinase [Calothrix sp. FACHB-1219]